MFGMGIRPEDIKAHVGAMGAHESMKVEKRKEGKGKESTVCSWCGLHFRAGGASRRRGRTVAKNGEAAESSVMETCRLRGCFGFNSPYWSLSWYKNVFSSRGLVYPEVLSLLLTLFAKFLDLSLARSLDSKFPPAFGSTSPHLMMSSNYNPGDPSA